MALHQPPFSTSSVTQTSKVDALTLKAQSTFLPCPTTGSTWRFKLRLGMVPLPSLLHLKFVFRNVTNIAEIVSSTQKWTTVLYVYTLRPSSNDTMIREWQSLSWLSWLWGTRNPCHKLGILRIQRILWPEWASSKWWRCGRIKVITILSKKLFRVLH